VGDTPGGHPWAGEVFVGHRLKAVSHCRESRRSARGAQPLREIRLSACNRPDDNKRLLAGRDRLGQRSVGRLVRQILLASKEAQKRPALSRVVVADGSAQHRIASFERIEHGALCHRAVNLNLHLAAGLRQRSKMEGENDADCRFRVNLGFPATDKIS
jgi:hypothetical protein